MKIRLPKIVIGRNIVGLQIAILKDAVFIPISFIPSFGWEFLNYDNPIISYLRAGRIEQYTPFIYNILTKEESIDVHCFQWELEELYKYLLFMSNRLFDSAKSNMANLRSDTTINIASKYGNSLEIEFEKCWVVNPEDGWFTSYLSSEEDIVGETTHLLYSLLLSKDTEDMKGISYQYDMETLTNNFFTKIWYSRLFGPKKFLTGYDPKRKKQTITTRHLCLFVENVPNIEIEEEIYSIAEARKEIYKLLAPRHKRISDRILTFDKNISKIELSSKVSIFQNTECVEYIYYTNKEEILCQKNLNYSDWPQSYPHILMSQLAEIVNSV